MKLTHIDVSKIVPNPDNPRGIDIQTQDDKLAYLKDSIKEFGVMVPIVVSQKKDGTFLLIDGERRFWACKALGLKKMPAFVLDEEGAFNDDDILYRMFQIHHNREQWAPVQQCHALETVYKRITRKPQIRSIQDERARLKAIGEELVEATGIEERTALNRVYFLRWPDKIKQKLYADPGEEGYWYICEIEEKIIIPAMTNYPEYFEKVPVDDVRVDLFKKLEEHTVLKSTDVRRVAPFFRDPLGNTNDRRKLKQILARLHKTADMTYSEAQDELHKAFPQALKRDPVSPRKLQSNIRTLQTSLEDFDISCLDSSSAKKKAVRREVFDAVKSLIASLQAFRELIAGETK